jgi:hypothetical protein
MSQATGYSFTLIQRPCIESGRIMWGAICPAITLASHLI